MDDDTLCEDLAAATILFLFGMAFSVGSEFTDSPQLKTPLLAGGISLILASFIALCHIMHYYGRHVPTRALNLDFDDNELPPEDQSINSLP